MAKTPKVKSPEAVGFKEIFGVTALYALPNGITTKAIVVSVRVIFFYLVYVIGASFYNQNLLFRTMTNDPGERSKLLIGPRLRVMILGVFGSMMAAIAVSTGITGEVALYL